jgi:MarR family transcriptional regulator, organic hydroperoxide resistance regulator
MDTIAQRRRSPADEAWAVLRELLIAERRRFLAAASELDLHPAQAGALLQMEPGTAVPMHELAMTLACDNSNVTGIVDRLEARGLVERRPYAQDRRVKHVVLTPEGADLRDRVRGRLAEAPEAIRRLTVADQRVLRDVLRRAVKDP